MLNDIQKLTLTHIVFSIIFAFIVKIFNLYLYFWIIALIGILVSGHFCQHILKIKKYKIGGILGWILNGVIVFLVWYIFISILLYNLEMIV